MRYAPRLPRVPQKRLGKLPERHSESGSFHATTLTECEKPGSKSLSALREASFPKRFRREGGWEWWGCRALPSLLTRVCVGAVFRVETIVLYSACRK